MQSEPLEVPECSFSSPYEAEPLEFCDLCLALGVYKHTIPTLSTSKLPDRSTQKHKNYSDSVPYNYLLQSNVPHNIVQCLQFKQRENVDQVFFFQPMQVETLEAGNFFVPAE